MEGKVMDSISEAIRENRRIALVTLTKSEGSTPGKEGSIMSVDSGGNIEGTVGGGKIEKTLIDEAVECIGKNQSKAFTYDLNASAELGMVCGGRVEGYIKVFGPARKLLIAGGGHVALELYQLASVLKYNTIIFEDREEFGNPDRFPQASQIILGDVAENLSAFPVDANTYVMLVTRGHKHDEEALKAVINSEAAYIGMIGSKSKAKKTLNKLLEEGYDEERVNSVYSPSGLGIGGTTPEEIALSILAEMQKVTHNGELVHLRDKMKNTNR